MWESGEVEVTDREKVVRAVETCFDSWIDKHRNMGLDLHEVERMKRDALELLKEQETEWEHLWDAPDGTVKGRCKKCGFVHFFIEGHDGQYKFCPECGRAVKWK